MKQDIHHGVQTFVTGNAGKLAGGRYVPCSSIDEATRYAERSVGARGIRGAAVVSIRNAGEFDEGEAPIVIATYGTVPPGVSDSLPF